MKNCKVMLWFSLKPKAIEFFLIWEDNQMNWGYYIKKTHKNVDFFSKIDKKLEESSYTPQSYLNPSNMASFHFNISIFILSYNVLSPKYFYIFILDMDIFIHLLTYTFHYWAQLLLISAQVGKRYATNQILMANKEKATRNDIRNTTL